jgi:hypothetical protein
MPAAPLGTTAPFEEQRGYAVRLIEQQSLVEVTGGDGRPAAAADLAFARFEHGYSSALLVAVHEQGVRLREATTSPDRPRFLGLDHLRRVQRSIPEVGELVHDEKRLAALSELAGVELETYPIGTSCSGINFYRPWQPTIELHRDGPAFVELVPLHVDGQQEGGSTVVFRGAPAPAQLTRAGRRSGRSASSARPESSATTIAPDEPKTVYCASTSIPTRVVTVQPSAHSGTSAAAQTHRRSTSAGNAAAWARPSGTPVSAPMTASSPSEVP